jgi:hypothetical protein
MRNWKIFEEIFLKTDIREMTPPIHTYVNREKENEDSSYGHYRGRDTIVQSTKITFTYSKS